MGKMLIKKIPMLILGNFLIAAAVSLFVSPSGFILGGATGVSLTLCHYFPLRLSFVILAINLFLLLIGYLTLGKEFTASTIINSLLYPFFMFLFERFPSINGRITENPMLAAAFGGVLIGAGTGLIIRTGGSSGGSDVIALVLNKYLHFNISVLLYLIDACILILQIPFSDLEQIFYGIFLLALLTQTMNRIMLMGKTQIQLLIISDQIEAIRQKVLFEEDTGATMVFIEKGYSGEKTQALMCILPRRKLYAVSEMIRETDPHAFWTISEVNEVHGLGFSYGKR